MSFRKGYSEKDVQEIQVQVEHQTKLELPAIKGLPS